MPTLYRRMRSCLGKRIKPLLPKQFRLGRVEKLFKDTPVAAPKGKKVLIYSPVPWELGRVEMGLGLALKTRGYEVVTYICGGDFSACEIENAKTLRPPCAQCVTMATGQQAPFGFVPKTVHSFIREDDVARASKVAAAWDGRDLADVHYEGLPVGFNVARYLHNYYHAATYEQDYDAGHVENARRCLESSILYFIAARRILANESPDIVILSNGKNLVYYPFFHQAHLYRIRTVTWDESVVFEDSLIFNHECFANEIHLESVWSRWRDAPLLPAEDERLNVFIQRRQKGVEGLTPIMHGAAAAVREFLCARGWDGARPLVAIYPNMAWDTAVVGRDVGFASLVDWLRALVELAKALPDRTFVFRAHPHEATLPRHFATSTPTLALLSQFGPLPDNIILIPPDVTLNSYALGQMAQQRVLYTGTLGLELAVDGYASLVCGDVHYRNKGFTIDILNAEHLREQVLAAPALTAEQQAWARRYMYLYVFRHLVRLGCIGKSTRFIPDPWFARLVPGATGYWQEFVAAVAGEREFDFGPSD